MSAFSPGRPQDAYFVIRGYVYQVQLTIRRWLALQAGEELELECGEDIDRLSQTIKSSLNGNDVVVRRERLLEQIKCHQNNVTLTSARMTLANFDAHRRKNASGSLALRFLYTTNAEIGKESPHLLPSFPEAAISIWTQLASDTLDQALVPTALRELKAALNNFTRPSDETSKPAKEAWTQFQKTIRNSSDAQLLAFVKAFEWATGSDDPVDLTSALQTELKAARWARSDEEAAQAHQKLFFYVFELLSQEGLKRLTPTDLQNCLKSGTPDSQARALVQIVDFLFSWRDDLAVQLRSVEENLRAEIASSGADIKAHIDENRDTQLQISGVRQRLDDVKDLLTNGKWITAQDRLKLARQSAATISDLTTRNELMCRIAISEGVCKWHEGAEQAAQRLFEEALRYQPESERAREHVAMMLVESHPAQAQSLAEKARLDAEVWPQASATWLRAIHQQEGWDGVTAQVQKDSSLKRDARCAQALGELALKNELYSLALTYAETGASEAKAPHALRLLANVLVAPLEKEDQDERNGRVVASEFVDAETGDWSIAARERMERAAGILDKALQLMQTWEIARPRAQTLTQRAATFHLLKNYTAAEKEVDRALVEDETNEQARYLKAILSSRNGATATAIALFDGLRQDSSDERTRFQSALLGAKALQLENRWAEVVEWLGTLWEPNDRERELIDVADLLLQAHHALQNDDVRQIQQQLQELYADDPVAWAVLSVHARRENKPRLAIRRMEKAWKLATESRWSASLRQDIARDLATQHAIRGHHKRAAILLAPIVRALEPNEALSNFLLCLYHVGRNKQALEVAEKARNNGRALFPISIVEAHIRAAVGDFDIAARLRREIQEQHPSNIPNVIALADLERHRGDVAAARQALESIPFEAIASNPYEMLEVAQARANFGLPEALEYAYRARKLAIDNADIHVGYAMLCHALSPKSEADPLLNIKQVDEECAVHLRWRNKTEVFTLTSRPITEIPDPHQIPLSDPRARLLLKKKVGDRVQLRSHFRGQREDPHEIVAIQSKYIHALHETTELFAQGVLQHPAFQVNQFEPGNPEEMLEQMRDFLRVNHENSQSIRNFYRQYAAPLSTIAQLRNRSLLSCWQGGFGDQFFVCEGTKQEIDDVEATIKQAQQGVVVLDETAILSLVYTGTEAVVIAHTSQLLVPQIVRDEFVSALQHAKDQDNTKGWLYGDGDTIGFQELSVERRTANMEFWQRALEFVDGHTEVVPVYGLTRLNHGETEIYTRPTLAAVLLAHERSCPLLSDDLRVRQWAKHSRNVPGFWTNALLLESAQSGQISSNRYFEALRQLILTGQGYLPLTGDFLVWACQHNGWKLTPEVRALFSVLNFWALHDGTASQITAEFLRALIRQPAPLAAKRELQKSILEALLKDRMSSRTLVLVKTLLLRELSTKRMRFTSFFLYHQLDQDVDEIALEIVKGWSQQMPQPQVSSTTSSFSAA